MKRELGYQKRDNIKILQRKWNKLGEKFQSNGVVIGLVERDGWYKKWMYE